jgi:hypothetical protein
VKQFIKYLELQKGMKKFFELWTNEQRKMLKTCLADDEDIESVNSDISMGGPSDMSLRQKKEAEKLADDIMSHIEQIDEPHEGLIGTLENIFSGSLKIPSLFTNVDQQQSEHSLSEGLHFSLTQNDKLEGTKDKLTVITTLSNYFIGRNFEALLRMICQRIGIAFPEPTRRTSANVAKKINEALRTLGFGGSNDFLNRCRFLYNVVEIIGQGWIFFPNVIHMTRLQRLGRPAGIVNLNRLLEERRFRVFEVDVAGIIKQIQRQLEREKMLRVQRELEERRKRLREDENEESETEDDDTEDERIQEKTPKGKNMSKKSKK